LYLLSNIVTIEEPNVCEIGQICSKHVKVNMPAILVRKKSFRKRLIERATKKKKRGW